MSFGKENTQKRRLLYSLLEKRPREQKYPLNIPYTDEDLGDELLIVVIDGCHCGLFIIPKEVAISKKILSTKDCKGKMSMRFYPPWCTNLNKTAQKTQRWQMDYFRIDIDGKETISDFAVAKENHVFC